VSPTTLRVALDNAPEVTALCHAAVGERTGQTLVLAHGAGAGQRHPFMVHFARGLSERGLEVVTFDFPYMAQGRRVPDPRDRLEACYRAVVEAVRARGAIGPRGLFVGGKSMGGRIATYVAAAMREADRRLLGGVVLLGYPLHPPGKPDRLRAAHLGDVGVPMLFVQGSRDSFGTPDELRAQLAGVEGVEILPVDGGDHSFKVPKRSGRTASEIHAELQDAIAAWTRRRR
jgi:hypothetical protein